MNHTDPIKVKICVYMQYIKKDIIAKADDVRQLEGDVRLVWDPKVVHKRLHSQEK